MISLESIPTGLVFHPAGELESAIRLLPEDPRTWTGIVYPDAEAIDTVDLKVLPSGRVMLFSEWNERDLPMNFVPTRLAGRTICGPAVILPRGMSPEEAVAQIQAAFDADEGD